MSVDEFLLNEEDIKKFLGLLDSKIEYMGEELDKIEKARKQFEGSINELKDKREILTRYFQFKTVAFVWVKTNPLHKGKDVDVEKDKHANETRINEEEPPIFCNMTYAYLGSTFTCLKLSGHYEPCGNDL